MSERPAVLKCSCRYSVCQSEYWLLVLAVVVLFVAVVFRMRALDARIAAVEQHDAR